MWRRRDSNPCTFLICDTAHDNHNAAEAAGIKNVGHLLFHVTSLNALIKTKNKTKQTTTTTTKKKNRQALHE